MYSYGDGTMNDFLCKCESYSCNWKGWPRKVADADHLYDKVEADDKATDFESKPFNFFTVSVFTVLSLWRSYCDNYCRTATGGCRPSLWVHLYAAIAISVVLQSHGWVDRYKQVTTVTNKTVCTRTLHQQMLVLTNILSTYLVYNLTFNINRQQYASNDTQTRRISSQTVATRTNATRTYVRKLMNCCKWWSRRGISVSGPTARLRRLMMSDSQTSDVASSRRCVSKLCKCPHTLSRASLASNLYSSLALPVLPHTTPSTKQMIYGLAPMSDNRTQAVN